MISPITQAKRIVIKIGTNALMGTQSSQVSQKSPNTDLLESIARQVVQLHDMGKDVVIVTSGSIGFGASELQVSHPITDIRIRQACACVGQPILMKIYKEAFGRHECHCGQLLLTVSDLKNQQSYMNLKDCVEVLFEKKVIPIVNENDSVSIEEIGERFGDNDNLSAVLAHKIDADLLVILTDVDGVYDKNPKKYDDAKKLVYIDEPQLQAMLDEKDSFENTGSHVGTGGMKTKLQAAKANMTHARATVIALATESDVLIHIMEGKEVGTVFMKKAH